MHSSSNPSRAQPAVGSDSAHLQKMMTAVCIQGGREVTAEELTRNVEIAPPRPTSMNRGEEGERVVNDMLHKVYNGLKPSREGRFARNYYYINHKKFESDEAVARAPSAENKLRNGEVDFIAIDRYAGLVSIEVKTGKNLSAAYTEASEQLYQNEFNVQDILEHVQSIASHLESHCAQLRKIKRDVRPILVPMFPLTSKTVVDSSPEGILGTQLIARDSIFFKEDFESKEAFKAKWSALMKGHAEDAEPFDKDTYEILLKSYVMHTPQFITTRSIQKDMCEIKKLTERQEELVFAQDKPRMLIKGTAGTGKTAVLLRKVQLLVESNPDARILFLTYNRNLCTSIQMQLEATPSRNPRESKMNIATWESFQHFLAGDEDTQEQSRSVSWPEDPPLKFHHLFIDEGQELFNLKDFRDQWTSLLSMVNEDGHIWIASDNYQYLQVWTLVEKPLVDQFQKELDKVHHFRDFVLNHIVRCNSTVSNLFMKYKRDDDGTRSESVKNICHPEHRGNPNLTKVKPWTPPGKSQDLLFRQSIVALEESLVYFEPSQITILFRTKELCISFIDFAATAKFTVQLAEKCLKLLQEGQGVQKDIIRVESVARFRGLESEQIIYVDCNLSDMNATMSDRYLHVALSRARSALYVVTNYN